MKMSRIEIIVNHIKEWNNLHIYGTEGIDVKINKNTVQIEKEKCYVKNQGN